jgi:hypothetical protein
VTTPDVGLIFECGPQGADKQVCEYLATQMLPGVRLRSRTLDNKANLLRDAGQVAAQLLTGGCRCVLIAWDLRPAWPDMKEKPCRHKEREELLTGLTKAGISDSGRVHLVCIEQELESWILANERAINASLSTPAHPYTQATREKRPDAVSQPKAALIEHFKMARGWRYDDKVHAIEVLRAAEVDLDRLRQSASFTRFEKKLQECAGTSRRAADGKPGKPGVPLKRKGQCATPRSR